MSRYNQNHGGSGGSNDYDDEIEVKLQEYAAIEVDLDRVYQGSTQWGDRLIPGYSNAAVLDGVVMQRDDKPGTWKVFGFDAFGFQVDMDSGLVYESVTDGEYENQLSAEEVLNHARVQGFSETFGGDPYFYTPVGVVVEEADEVALNDDIDVADTDETKIPIGDAAMFLDNKSWVRTFAKKITEAGSDVIATTKNDDGDEVAVKEDSGWIAENDLSVREDLEGRTLELFVVEEQDEFDGETVTYTSPVLLDQKTEEQVTIDNGVSEGESDESEEQASDEGGQQAEAAADGGSVQEEPDAEPEADDDYEVPDVLDEVFGYFVRNEEDDITVERVREFAGDEVDDPDAIDWESFVAEIQAEIEG